MYLVKTPNALKPFAADLRWSIDSAPGDVFITFDDGPTAEITYKILNILDSFEAKATFFCIGGNVKALPEQYAEILKRGHKTGNHTWNHMNGWEYSDYAYFKNIIECSQLVDSHLFRPPYGKIKRSQVHSLKKKYTVVMWDVLSADWLAELSPEKCAQNVIKNTRGGSIVVFHDSKKAEKNMLYALPKSLEYLTEKGFNFKGLPDRF